MMFNNPWFLLLLGALPLFWWMRQHRFFLRHAYVQPMRVIARPNRLRLVKGLCYGLAVVALILAAADPQVKVHEKKRTLLVHKYVLINDGSGSMVEGNKPLGVGRALGTVRQGNEAFLKALDQRDDGSKDLVGAVVFSNEAYVVSHLVDDPAFVDKKLSYVDYRVAPMGQGTQLERALWAGLYMVLNVGKDGELSDDMKKLQTRMFGQGLKVNKDALVQKIIDERKEQTKGSSLVIFTDGIFSQPEGSQFSMSCFKIMDLCKYLGVRVYVISVEQLQDLVLIYCRETGGNGVVIRDYDKAKFEQAYADIVRSQTNEFVMTEQAEDKSLAMMLAGFGLCALCLNLFLANTWSRVFTEV